MSGTRSVPPVRSNARGRLRLAWLLAVVALVLVAPVRTAGLERVAAEAGAHSGRTHATDTHTWAGVRTDAVKAAARDRKTVPGGAAVTIALSILLLGAVLVVRRVRPDRAGKPRVAFRRRGPPFRIVV